MQYLNWDGTFIFDSWGDSGSPGDPPTSPSWGQINGITNADEWGTGVDVYTIYGTPGADLIVLDRVGRDTPRLINVTNISGGAGNDVIDLTSQRFKYGPVTINGGTGNDWLFGNASGDRLLGQSGSDRLKGYGGNDYLNGGNNNDYLHGGRGNDKLLGGWRNDTLVGQWGKDTLTGGKGYDKYVFDVSPTSSNRDTITDFSIKYDTIQLARSVFTKAGPKGALKEKAFWIGSAAHDLNDRIIYNDQKGYVYYDPDGTGGASQKLVAKLSKGLEMTHKDFFII
jgi:Ca2+-binding RTX toxin-like protein